MNPTMPKSLPTKLGPLLLGMLILPVTLTAEEVAPAKYCVADAVATFVPDGFTVEDCELFTARGNPPLLIFATVGCLWHHRFIEGVVGRDRRTPGPGPRGEWGAPIRWMTSTPTARAPATKEEISICASLWGLR